jgi:hypothetical protein
MNAANVKRSFVAALSFAIACDASIQTPTGVLPGEASSRPSGARASASGPEEVPCEVADVLARRCTSCHGASPSGGAPTSLVSFADLSAISAAHPGETAAARALARMRDGVRPMPPGGTLPEDEIAPLARWVAAGAPREACDAASATRTRPDAGPCVLSSDCPGAFVCRAGACELECAADKDCAVGLSCIETRCTPPASPAPPSDAGARETFGALGDLDAWTAYDVPGIGAAPYSGAVFDGRFVTFAPDNTSGLALRVDTQGPFTAPRAWYQFDLTTVDAGAKGYRGAVFDGRYLYFVPLGLAPVARFDTRGSFLDPASWSFFRTETLGVRSFTGATFDGRYLYFVPSTGASTALRYDTAAPFTLAASWSAFAFSSLSPDVTGTFVGAVFDGRFVTFVPNMRAGAPHGVVVRYDGERPFGDRASWAYQDLTAFRPEASGFRTGAFDGRFLYLVPGWTAPNPAWGKSTVARFDTRGPLDEAASWSFLDTASLDTEAVGFNGAAFDGRYVYFEPGSNGLRPHGKVVRWDTRKATLDDATGWSTFDVANVRNGLFDLRGAASDGKYVYFAPRSGVAVRFSARTSDAVPPAAHGGSFY